MIDFLRFMTFASLAYITLSIFSPLLIILVIVTLSILRPLFKILFRSIKEIIKKD